MESRSGILALRLSERLRLERPTCDDLEYVKATPDTTLGVIHVSQRTDHAERVDFFVMKSKMPRLDSFFLGPRRTF